jgi:hypothetical protein
MVKKKQVLKKRNQQKKLLAVVGELATQRGRFGEL